MLGDTDDAQSISASHPDHFFDDDMNDSDDPMDT